MVVELEPRTPGVHAHLDPSGHLAFQNITHMLQMEGLWNHLISIDFVTADRIFFTATTGLYAGLVYRVYAKPKTWTESPSSGGPHDMVYQVYNGLDPKKWGKRTSFRQLKRPSLQITLTEHGHSYRGDADVDLGNPMMDLVGFFTHLFEVIVPGKTDHQKLERKITARYVAWLKEQTERKMERKENV